MSRELVTTAELLDLLDQVVELQQRAKHVSQQAVLFELESLTDPITRAAKVVALSEARERRRNATREGSDPR